MTIIAGIMIATIASGLTALIFDCILDDRQSDALETIEEYRSRIDGLDAECSELAGRLITASATITELRNRLAKGGRVKAKNARARIALKTNELRHQISADQAAMPAREGSNHEEN